ncbi:MAG TPA: gas vesicle protein GvpG [Longimicrobiales bacterium]|nr:gas vesicle protein GvpG [Longimicrobiales bacterium]
MGLLKHLLFWPVTGPSFLTRFSLQKVEGAVRTELTDDAGVKRDLMELQMRLELGDIDDEEYVAREAEIMARFRQVREWRERFGMATSGGLVRVAEDATGDDAGDPGPKAAGEEGEERPRVAGGEGAEIDFTLGFDED